MLYAFSTMSISSRSFWVASISVNDLRIFVKLTDERRVGFLIILRRKNNFKKETTGEDDS